MRLLASLFHLSAAAYIAYVAVRDSDPNPLYFLGVGFFLLTAGELLLQQFRRAPTPAYSVVTVLNVAFVPFVVIACLTIIGDIFGNNASPAEVLPVVVLLIGFSATSLRALRFTRVLAPGTGVVVAVAITTLVAATVLALPHYGSLRGLSRGGYIGHLEMLNRLAMFQGVASIALVIAWVFLVIAGIMRRRRLNRTQGKHLSSTIFDSVR
jgi:hypothetical protein